MRAIFFEEVKGVAEFFFPNLCVCTHPVPPVVPLPIIEIIESVRLMAIESSADANRSFIRRSTLTIMNATETKTV